MQRRRFEREAVTEGGSGGASPAPAGERTILQDVEAVIAEFEGSASGGQASASENPAPATAPAAPAAAAPAGDQTTPAATPGQQPPPTFYTDEELAAFEGEYDRRDFDWNKVDPALRARLKILESGTGKYRSRLEDRLRREFEERNKPNQTAPAASAGQPPAAPANLTDVWNEFVNADTPEKGLAAMGKLLQTEAGKAALAAAGYTDPQERAVVSEIVQDRVIQNAIIEAQEDFPALVSDKSFLDEVRTIIGKSPKALQILNGRSAEDAAEVFRVASARVVQGRLAAREQDLSGREAKLIERENTLKAKEADLQRQIEASNRTETTQQKASIAGGGTPSGGPKRETTILDDVNELAPKFGLFSQ